MRLLSNENLVLALVKNNLSFALVIATYMSLRSSSRFLAECKSDDGVTHTAKAGDTLSDRERILKKFRDNPDAEPEDAPVPQKCMASSLTGVPRTDYKKFERGTIVEHPNLGRGEVVLPVTDMNAAYITIRFDSCGNKTLSLKFANLKIVQ